MFSSSIPCSYFIYFNISLYRYMINWFQAPCFMPRKQKRSIAVLTFWLILSGQLWDINTDFYKICIVTIIHTSNFLQDLWTFWNKCHNRKYNYYCIFIDVPTVHVLYRVYKKKGNRTSARYYTWITRRMNNWFTYSERSGF
jgi:uncharacterized membrane protein YbaN (DUF454 family)